MRVGTYSSEAFNGKYSICKASQKNPDVCNKTRQIDEASLRMTSKREAVVSSGLLITSKFCGLCFAVT
jgi:hypothetical protein